MKKKRIGFIPPKFCANCCSPNTDINNEEFVTEINVQLNSKSSRKKSWLKIEKVLSLLFKLEFVNHLFNEDQDEIGVCPSCAIILENLYKFYTDFYQLCQPESYLSKRIDTCNQLIQQVKETWTQMGESSQLSDKIIKDELPNDDDPGQEFNDDPPTPDNIAYDLVDLFDDDLKPIMKDNCPFVKLSRLTSQEITEATTRKTNSKHVQGPCNSQVETLNSSLPLNTENDNEMDQTEIKIEQELDDMMDANEEDDLFVPMDGPSDNSSSDDDDDYNEEDDKEEEPAERVKIVTKVLTVPHKRKEDEQNDPKTEFLGDGKYLYNKECPFVKNSDRTYTCGTDGCGKILQRIDSMKKHICRWHCSGSYKCQDCEKSFISPEILKRHRCNENIHFRSSIVLGEGQFLYRNVWPFHVDPDDHNDPNRTYYKCGSCPVVRNGRKSMTAHIKLCHAEPRAHVCEVCGQSLQKRSSYVVHMKIHSGHEFICDTCGKTFTMKHSLEAHIKQVHVGAEFKCDFEGCNRVLTTRGGLYFHKKTHKCGRIQEHECPNCHKKYMHKHGLKAHMQKSCETNKEPEEEEDNGKTKFQCNFEGCTKLLTKMGLYFHMKTHECGGVSQHECPHCQKKFMQKHGLKSHILAFCKKKPPQSTHSIVNDLLTPMNSMGPLTGQSSGDFRQPEFPAPSSLS